MSINLSGRQLNDPGLVRHIASSIERWKVRPDAIILEITESVVISDADAATQIFHQLRALGVQLYMDDFGSGYSSLNSLQQFPLDGLKIDRKFIQNASGRRRGRGGGKRRCKSGRASGTSIGGGRNRDRGAIGDVAGDGLRLGTGILFQRAGECGGGGTSDQSKADSIESGGVTSSHCH